MKTLIATLIAVLSVFSFNATASNDPFSVTIGKEVQQTGTEYRYVKLTPKQSGLVINSLQVIGEDCQPSTANRNGQIKTTLGANYFWAYFIVGPMSSYRHPCIISEVIIKTNMGDYSYEPEPYYD